MKTIWWVIIIVGVILVLILILSFSSKAATTTKQGSLPADVQAAATYFSNCYWDPGNIIDKGNWHYREISSGADYANMDAQCLSAKAKAGIITANPTPSGGNWITFLPALIAAL